MVEQGRKNNLQVMILVSLGIHILLFILFLRMDHSYDNLISLAPLSPEEALQQPSQQSPLFNNDIASLKPKASQFGAPVMFQDEPDVPQPPAPPDQLVGNLVDDQALEERHEKPEDGIENSAHDSTLDTQKQHDSNEQQPNQSSESLESIPLENNATSPLHEEQPSSQSAQNPPRKKIRRKRQATEMSPATTSGSKKQLTFADLAQGFLDSIKNEGEDCVERIGNDNLRPDLEEMKKLSYLQKIIWYLQNSWKRNPYQIKGHLDPKLALTVLIIIDKEGILTELTVLEPSGVDEIDHYILKGIRNAGPFPPVPQHLNMHHFTLPLTIHFYDTPSYGSTGFNPPTIQSRRQNSLL